MPFDAYSVYCQWQIDRGLSPPTREWWDSACAKWAANDRSEAALDQAEIDRECREGWAYGDRT